MRYYKVINGDHISLVGIGAGGRKISEKEYRTIMSAIKDRPTPPVGHGLRLRTDMTWEQYKLPPVIEEGNDGVQF